jgi:hypothetical protein
MSEQRRHHKDHGHRGMRWVRARIKHAADKKAREVQHEWFRKVLPPDLHVGDTVRVRLASSSEIALVLAMDGKQGTIVGISEGGGYYVSVSGLGTHEFLHADLSS